MREVFRRLLNLNMKAPAISYEIALTEKETQEILQETQEEK